MLRRFGLALAVGLGLAGAWALSGSAGTPAGCRACTVNLIKNPGADAAAGSTSDSVVTVPGWTGTGGFTAAPYSWSGGDISSTSPGPPDEGKPSNLNYFYGGPNAAVSTATQTIALPSADDGLRATLSGWLGGYSNQTDDCTVTVFFHDTAGQLLGEVAIGPVTESQRHGTSELVFKTASLTVPAHAASASVLIRMVRYDGSDNDGMADSLSLTLAEPGATSTQTTGTTTSARATAPGAVANLAVTAGDEQVVAQWSPPASTGGAPITSYQLRWTQMRSGVVGQKTVVGDVTQVPIGGLTNGDTIDVTVRAVNSAGFGPAVQAHASPAKPPPSPPGVASHVTAAWFKSSTPFGSSNITISWSDSAPHASQGYDCYQYNFTPAGQTPSSAPPAPQVVEHVASGVMECQIGNPPSGAYTFGVTSKLGSGPVASPKVKATVPVFPPPPSHVEIHETNSFTQAGGGGTYDFNITWTPVQTASSTADTSYDYDIYIHPQGSLNSNEWSLLGVRGATNPNFPYVSVGSPGHPAGGFVIRVVTVDKRTRVSGLWATSGPAQAN